MFLDSLLKTEEGDSSYEELKMFAQDRSRWSQCRWKAAIMAEHCRESGNRIHGNITNKQTNKHTLPQTIPHQPLWRRTVNIEPLQHPWGAHPYVHLYVVINWRRVSHWHEFCSHSAPQWRAKSCDFSGTKSTWRIWRANEGRTRDSVRAGACGCG